MKVVVDSNIIISGLININGNEFTILANRLDVLNFFSSKLIIDETAKKFKQISSLTKNSESDIQTQFYNIINVFQLVDENKISNETLRKANLLIEDLDRSDYLFLAVAIHCYALLWTGDLKLFRGLRRKGFNSIVTTKELKEIIKGL